MDSMRSYAESVSILGGSAFWLMAMLGINWAFSAIHIYEEWKGSEVPLWRVFGAIEGVYVPDWVGFPLFTFFLLIIQWIVGVGGIAGWFIVGLAGWWPIFGPLSPLQGTFWLGVILGGLVSDSVFSHWIPYFVGYRPNPGLRSTPLYVVEAVLILAIFWKGLSSCQLCAFLGFLLGTLFFIAVWGLTLLLRLSVRPWRHAPWVRWQPIPSWAKT